MAEMSAGEHRYDEAEILARVEGLAPTARVLFACTCAEQLMPAYGWFHRLTGTGDPELVRAALDAGWAVDTSAALPSAEVDRLSTRVEDLVPTEDEADGLPAIIAQNAVAAVAYVLRALRSRDAQDSVWAARQLYEAADAIVQQGAPVQEYVRDIDREEPVRLVVREMSEAPQDVSQLSADSLRSRARGAGEQLVALVTVEGARTEGPAPFR